MANTYWQKQKPDEPLFPDLLWSKPEQKSSAGKLLIIGGNLHAFAAPAEAYAESLRSGIGVSRTVLPDAAKKIVGPLLEGVDYLPSTPSGSFSKKALAELLDSAAWADGVLLPGDLGKNSETAILLENFLKKYNGPAVLAKDAVDYLLDFDEEIFQRQQTVIVTSFNQLQKLAVRLKLKKPFLFDMDLIRFVELLHEFSAQINLSIIIQHSGGIFCAHKGRVTSTKSQIATNWNVKTSARAAVWVVQNPSKPLEAISTAVFELQQG